MNTVPLKRVPTLFLKAVLVLIGLGALAACVFSFPHVWYGAPAEWPRFAYVIYPGLIGIYATIVPFLFAVYQALKLLQYIDKNNAFSEASIRALRTIKFCAIAVSVLYAIAMPLMYVIAEIDDAPGLILMWAAVCCAPLIVATFAAVLQKLVRSALDMKTEHDLTI